MNFLSQYGLFFAEIFTVVAAILLTVAGIIALSGKGEEKKKLKIVSLSEKLEKEKEQLLRKILSKKDLKEHLKKIQKEKKKNSPKNTTFVVPFIGDIQATGVETFREIIDLILSVAKNEDEVVIKLESGGGTVNGYGLAATQIQRLRDNGTFVTVCIDKIAASGGYLMAAKANNIIAAPFSIIGSIGVVAQLPNFHRFLKKHDVDVELITAGDHKRTLTIFGENTEEDREKFTKNLQEIHEAFKESITEHRSNIDLKAVANGDYWLGSKAYELNLIDEISTSDEHLHNKYQERIVIEISEDKKTSKLKKFLQSSFSQVVTKYTQ